jgi:hypothetical protein
VADKLLKHLREEPLPIERFRSDIPPEVAALVRKMLAKKPEERYQTPADVAAAVSLVLGVGSKTSMPEEKAG